VRQDPIFFRTGGERLGRDGCRVPMPWTAARPAYGFTTGTPWLPQPQGFAGTSVEAEGGDETSMLALYRAALAERPTGPFAWRDSPPAALAFAREGMVSAVNVGGDPLPLPEGEVVIASEPLAGSIPAGAAAWIRPR